MNDKNIQSLLNEELERQKSTLQMIPSENYASLDVLTALGSIPTNKYAEGYPGNRYYGGTGTIDKIESLAIERAKKLFGAEHVNVQPLSGSPANLAAYSSILSPSDTVLGMDLTHGGHLTHGHPLTLPAKIYKFVRYGTEPDGSIDMEKVRKLALEHKPKLILCGYSSYSRDLDYKGFKRVADEVGAYTMADIAHIAGLIAAGLMKNPVPIFDIVTTTTHKTLRGPRGGMIMCKKELAEKIDKAVFPGVQGGPHENNIAALAVALDEASRPEFKSYAAQIMKNAKALCDALRERGMKIMFGGTENHLVLADVTPLGTTGKQAQVELESVGIVLNKNVIPNDPRKPFDPSGIRLGTPAVTTRGMKEKDMVKIADMITRVLKGIGDESAKSAVRAEVSEMLESFPIYRGMKYG